MVGLRCDCDARSETSLPGGAGWDCPAAATAREAGGVPAKGERIRGTGTGHRTHGLAQVSTRFIDRAFTPLRSATRLKLPHLLSAHSAVSPVFVYLLLLLTLYIGFSSNLPSTVG